MARTRRFSCAARIFFRATGIRPEETAKALRGGWFHTGDQGEVNAAGNWRITGRLKNLIILNSGHNIAPEPIGRCDGAKLPEAGQVVLVGNERSYLAALVTAAAPRDCGRSRIREFRRD